MSQLHEEIAPELGGPDERPFDPSAPLVASGNLRRRQWVSRIAEGGAGLSALLAVGVLGLVVYTVLARGGSALNIGFLTKDPPLFGGSGGGVAPFLVGTVVLVALATAIAMPVAVLVALYITEFADRRLARTVRTALDLLNGLPSIVIGLFVYGLLVVGHGESGIAASFALSIIMIPLIARTTQEVLLLVPASQREAADALGVSRWRAVRGVVLPSALGGIVTATVLAAARAAGETAPVLLLSGIFLPNVQFNPFGHALPNVPVSIFQLSEQADPAGYTRAWGEAFVLVSFILLTSLAARAMLVRSRAKLTR